MGLFESKPLMVNESTSTDDLENFCKMEHAILKKDLEKVKQLSQFKYNVTDCIFLAAKEGQVEILKHLIKNLKPQESSRASLANLSAI